MRVQTFPDTAATPRDLCSDPRVARRPHSPKGLVVTTDSTSLHAIPARQERGMIRMVSDSNHAQAPVPVLGRPKRGSISRESPGLAGRNPTSGAGPKEGNLPHTWCQVPHFRFVVHAIVSLMGSWRDRRWGITVIVGLGMPAYPVLI